MRPEHKERRRDGKKESEVGRRAEAQKERDAFHKLAWTIEHRVITVPWESASFKQCRCADRRHTRDKNRAGGAVPHA